MFIRISPSVIIRTHHWENNVYDYRILHNATGHYGEKTWTPKPHLTPRISYKDSEPFKAIVIKTVQKWPRIGSKLYM